MTHEECERRFLKGGGKQITADPIGTWNPDDHSFNFCYCLGIFTEEEQKDIEKTKAHLDYEIIKAVTELDEAMVIAMISFSFPF